MNCEVRGQDELYDRFQQLDWDDISMSIYAKTAQDVERALAKPKRDLEDFKALISPAAEPYLEQMAKLSYSLTRKRLATLCRCISRCTSLIFAPTLVPIVASLWRTA